MIVIDHITDKELTKSPGENLLETTLQSTIATIASQTPTGVEITPNDVTIDKILSDTPEEDSVTVDYTITVNDASNAQITAALLSDTAATEITEALNAAGFESATTTLGQTTLTDLSPTSEPTKSPSSKTKYPSPEPTGAPTNLVASVIVHQGISGNAYIYISSHQEIHTSSHK